MILTMQQECDLSEQFSKFIDSDRSIADLVLELNKFKKKMANPFKFATNDTGDILLGEVKLDTSVLCIPSLVPLHKYRQFLKNYYALDKSDINGIAYGSSYVPMIKQGFKNVSESLDVYISGASESRLEMSIDFTSSKMNNFIEQILVSVGEKALLDFLPGLRSFTITSKRSYVKKQEYYINFLGQIIF